MVAILVRYMLVLQFVACDSGSDFSGGALSMTIMAMRMLQRNTGCTYIEGVSIKHARD